jgi:pimeloyl-ACP methyl ester carboxylesterase
MTTRTVTEEVLRTRSGLVGILTGDGEAVEADRPAVVILNSGVIHRVGACRVSVSLARRLARLGHPVLRFDHHGIGDSPPRQDALEGVEGRVSEIVEAMDAVAARTGSRAFVLYGLCSGARDAFHAALEDERVVGIVQVDGFAYRTLRYHLGKLVERVRDPRMLMRSVQRRLAPTRRGGTAAESDGDMWVQQWPDYPPRREVEAGYGRLVARGVHIHALYTGSWQDQYNYSGQFRDMYSRIDFDGRLTVRCLPEARHILPDPTHREMVIGGVAEWITRAFEPAGTPP